MALCVVAALLVLGPYAAYRAIHERSSRGDSTVEISDCILNQAGPVKSATIRYTVTNNGQRPRSYVLRFEVADATGARVGNDVEFVNDVGAGQTVRGEAVAMLGATGQRCGLVEWR